MRERKWATVRERTWKTGKDVEKTAWVVDYADERGKRVIETCRNKAHAEQRRAEIRVEIAKGTHTASSRSTTVKQAADLWLENCAAKRLQRTTIDNYRQHVARLIVPHLGRHRLAKLTVASIYDFKAALQGEGRSDDLMRKVLVSLGSLLKFAQRRGLVGQNVMAGFDKELPNKRRKLQVGIDIPSPPEIAKLLAKYHGSYRPLLVTAICTGLRSSELRGLRWSEVDLKKEELHVRQRADRYGDIHGPKTESGERTVPLSPTVLTTLKQLKLQAKPGRELVFPARSGRPQDHANIINYGLNPALKMAGLTTPDGKPKYSMHSLRHFFASWCINRKKECGMELPPQHVKDLLGHSSLKMTVDRYGHLFPRTDAHAEFAEAERLLLAAAG